MEPNYKKIILSRTDNLGDVMLTLPMAGYLKKRYPESTIYFIGKAYTAPLIRACCHIDFFLDREKVVENADILKQIGADLIVHVFPDKKVARAAYQSGIPVRVGTGHRIFHWLYCNKLVHLTRKNSGLHETILNFKLLQAVLPDLSVTIQDIPELYGFSPQTLAPPELLHGFNKGKTNIVLHPKSKGSAREWPLRNYLLLAQQFPRDRYDFFITGTAQEGELIKKDLPELFKPENIHDLTGKLGLPELIAFIDRCDALVACSTGPLHIAAALGKLTVGLYPPMKPIDPGRWAALGKKTCILVINKNCSACKLITNCDCLAAISVGEVSKALIQKYG